MEKSRHLSPLFSAPVFGNIIITFEESTVKKENGPTLSSARAGQSHLRERARLGEEEMQQPKMHFK